MKRGLTLFLLMALLIGGCKDATAPSEPTGVVIPDDGKVYFISGPMEAPKGLSLSVVTPDGGVGTGRFAMSCVTITDSRRCTLYWLGATAMTTVAIATCATGFLSWSCGGALLSALYSWDQFYGEPPCGWCYTPFDVRTSGRWYRTDTALGRK